MANPVAAYDPVALLDVICEIARCPISGGALTPVTDLDPLNREIQAGRLLHADGSPISEPLTDALRAGSFVYRVDDGIAALLPQLAIGGDASDLDQNAQVVRDFYEQFGWKKHGDLYQDTELFVDQRPLTQPYLSRSRSRVQRHLPAGGRFLLDAASGPVQYPEYRTLSEGFDYHVCVDFSPLALQEAKNNLGEKAVCILGDVTRLPIRSESCDAVVSQHTIYHVTEQERAFRELYRVLSPGATAVVVYAWGDRFPVRGTIRRVLAKLGWKQESGVATHPPLFAEKHTYSWFRRQKWPFRADVSVWRLVTGPFLKKHVHGRSGHLLLKILTALEETAPRLSGRFGRYAMIIIRKSPNATVEHSG